MVVAWIDQNSSGVMDLPDELPLEGVTFRVVGAQPGYDRSLITEADGQARTFLFPMTCPTMKFEIYAEVPSGYRATTPIRTVAFDFQFFEVGFVKEP